MSRYCPEHNVSDSVPAHSGHTGPVTKTLDILLDAGRVIIVVDVLEYLPEMTAIEKLLRMQFEAI